MSKDRKSSPDPKSRNARLQAALRANLARRKAQARVRAEQGGAGRPAPSDEARNMDGGAAGSEATGDGGQHDASSSASQET